MTLYVIGIGGTGAKCLEAIVHLSSLGLLPLDSEQSVNLLYVDADETNGNLERSKATLTLYQKCYSLLSRGHAGVAWMSTPVKSFSLWSPFGRISNSKNLGSFFNYNTLKQNTPLLGSLFDALYTSEEREATLDVGFRGRPAIGSAVMSQVDLQRLDEEPWKALIEKIQADTGSGKSPRIVLYGSIFGGTGASGLPTLGRLIANKLENLNVRDRVSIAGVFLLPYFGFSPPPNGEPDSVYARTEQFLLNTEAALQYYVTQAAPIFNMVYLLGNHTLSTMRFSIGKQTQKNEAHFIELLSGLAARHFLTLNLEERGSVVLLSRETRNRLTWADLPDSSAVKSGLVNATRFAYVWLSNIAPELLRTQRAGVRITQEQVPWFTKFYKPSASIIGQLLNRRGEELPDFNNPEEQQAIELIGRWCQDYLRWLLELHECEGETIHLFQTAPLSNLDGQEIQPDELANLLVEPLQEQTKRSGDTIPALRVRLSDPDTEPIDKGTIGLAKTLYELCKL